MLWCKHKFILPAAREETILTFGAASLRDFKSGPPPGQNGFPGSRPSDPPTKSNCDADCVQFLRKCAKNFASNISEADLNSYVKNFEDNHVAGSIILNFSDAEWKDLIFSMGFRKFVCQAWVSSRLSDLCVWDSEKREKKLLGHRSVPAFFCLK